MSSATTHSIDLVIPPAAAPGADADTAASRQARSCYDANLAALRSAQPALAMRLPPAPAPLEWLYARDGALSARRADGRWLADCSLPMRAAGELLRTLDAPGRVSLFLLPTHAAQLRLVLDRLSPRQAVIALVEDLRLVGEMLACDDFSVDISAGRLLLITGADAADQLRQLLLDRPGLTPPQQYFRTRLLPDATGQRLMETMGQVIETDVHRRTEVARQMQDQLRPDPAGPVLALAGRLFRCWDFLAPALIDLGRSLNAQQWRAFDLDDPGSAATLAMLDALQGSAAIVAPGLTRANLPEAVPTDLPVITWLAAGPIPAPPSSANRDALILGSEELIRQAREGAWTDSRILLAAPPVPRWDAPGRQLTLIIDAGDICPKSRDFTLSSHRLLFEAIGEELVHDPQAVGLDVLKYLASRAAQLGIELANLDLSLFIDQLILPACARGIAMQLASANLPLRLFGEGWETVDGLQPFAAGPVQTHQQFHDALSDAAAIVDVWPTDRRPALRWSGRPILCTRGQSRPDLLRRARQILSSPSRKPPESPVPVLTAGILREFIESLTTVSK